jgi:hypothetical protein
MALTRRQIIEALGGLSSEDRAEIVKWCDALGVQNLTRSDNPNAEHAFGTLAILFSTHYHYPPLSLTTFARTRAAEYRKLLRAIEHTMRLIDAWWPKERRNTKLALLRYLCTIAFDVSTRRSARVGWSQVVAALQNIEAYVNDAFPGWLRAGVFQQRALERVTGGLHVREESNTFTRSGREQRVTS